MANGNLTAERLRELLQYDPETGVFTYRRKRGNNAVGSKAGAVTTDGRILIGVDYVRYKAHRLAWLYVHGEWPSGIVDHINGDATDNRIANLRVVSHMANIQNQRRAHHHSKSKLLGVTKHTQADGYFARIETNGKRQYLGYFETPEEAHAAYLEAKRRLHDGCTI